MQKGINTVLLSFLLLTGISVAHAGDISRPGAGKTVDCESCHGLKGCKPIHGLMPKICGQNKEYLVMTLVQFRDGKRISPIMHDAMSGVSDELINQLADYFGQAD